MAVMALLMVIALALLVDHIAVSQPTAFAAPAQTSDPLGLNIKCLETRVQEGDDFQLEVRRQFTSDHFFPDMRVSRHTAGITADETDYEHLSGVRQTSNVLEAKAGKMRREFHTLGDYFPEAEETFKVWFESSESDGQREQCIIAILDDDGVGIYDL